MNKTVILTFLLAIVFTVASAQKTKIFDDQNAVPPNFGKTETTLMVIMLPKMKSQNKALEESFTKYYKGKFVMVALEDIYNEEYKDIAAYSYVFLPKSIWQEASGTGESRIAAHWIYTGKVLDRIEDEYYGVDFQANNFKKFFASYAAKLEEVRSLNAGE